LPAEIKRREDWLAAMAEAKAKIAVRAQERFECEQAVYAAKVAQREAKARKTGKKPGGKPPQSPLPGVQPADQINLTDEESRIMSVSGGGFEQAYNAQAAVDADSLPVVAAAVTQTANDEEQVVPRLKQLAALPPSLSKASQLLVDSGFYSGKNVAVCEETGIEAPIAVARDEHHAGWRERFTEPVPLPNPATPAKRMAHRLKTKAGRDAYALRKQTVEAVFGIIKSVLGFRQFLLRGLRQASGEWHLVCLAWNLKRMATLRPQT